MKFLLDKINMWLANQQSLLLSNMYFWWFCVMLVTMATLFPQLTPICTFISTSVIQLLALPVLAFCSDISTNKIVTLLTDIWNWEKESHATTIEEIKLLKETLITSQQDTNLQEEDISLQEECNNLLRDLHKKIDGKDGN